MNREQRALSERLSTESAWHDDLYERESVGGWMKSSLRAWLYSGNTARAADRFYQLKVSENLLEGKILEIGAGVDNDSIRLAQNGQDICVIDISEPAVRSIKREADEKDIEINGVVCAAEYLPFRDNSFVMAIGESILHHTELEIALKEVKRVMLDKGKGVFREPLQGNILLGLFRNLTPDSRTPDEQPFTKQDWELLEEMFKIEEVKHFFFLTLLSIPIALLNRKWATKIWKILDRIDQRLICLIPFIREWFWQAVIVLAVD